MLIELHRLTGAERLTEHDNAGVARILHVLHTCGLNRIALQTQ